MAEMISLASYPRSGNTWMRYMLETATKRFTGSVHYDPLPGGLPTQGTPLVVKTHYVGKSAFPRAVWLLRHPYDAIASYFKYRHNFDDRTDLTWEQHVNEQLPAWQVHYAYWNNFPDRILIRYEDMLKDPGRELRRTLDYIKWPYDDAAITDAVAAGRLEVITPKLRPKFIGKATSGYGREQFTEAQREQAKGLLAAIAQQQGYEL
jgi:hypothetical protein